MNYVSHYFWVFFPWVFLNYLEYVQSVSNIQKQGRYSTFELIKNSCGETDAFCNKSQRWSEDKTFVIVFTLISNVKTSIFTKHIININAQTVRNKNNFFMQSFFNHFQVIQENSFLQITSKICYLCCIWFTTGCFVVNSTPSLLMQWILSIGKHLTYNFRVNTKAQWQQIKKRASAPQKYPWLNLSKAQWGSLCLSFSQ